MPQTITRKDGEAVVLIAAEEFELLARRKRPQTLVEFFAQSPLAKVDIDLQRARDFGREVVLHQGIKRRRR